MNICVINGSPKGENSITLQSVVYLQKHFPKDTFEVFNVGHINAYEKSENMLKVLNCLKYCELILFAYPVYTFVAPYQLHRFIELLKEQNITFLKGKCVAQITTSKHFFDYTAHRFIEENCKDMQLFPLKPLSADMDDLLKKEGRVALIDYFNYIKFAMFNTAQSFKEATAFDYVYHHPKSHTEMAEKKEDFDTVLITDLGDTDTSLKNMIDGFVRVYPYKVRIINLKDLIIKSGCLGCFGCAVTEKCVINDGFDAFLRGQIQNADVRIIAATIKDHFLGTNFKKFDDRQFCNGHRTVNMGQPVGYILNGEYSKNSNLKDILEGRADVGRNFFAGVATSESKDSTQTYDSLEALALTLAYGIENKPKLPQNFLGVGGMKIFRDLIYVMRGLMKADHKFYKENNFYDFPQKQKSTLLKMQLVGALLANKAIAKKASKFMGDAILKPYKKAIMED